MRYMSCPSYSIYESLRRKVQYMNCYTYYTGIRHPLDRSVSRNRIKGERGTTHTPCYLLNMLSPMLPNQSILFSSHAV